MQTLKMNATTVKHLRVNQTITTHHMKYIFMSVDQTIIE